MDHASIAARDDREGSSVAIVIVENYFQYTPNLGAAIFFAAVYGLITIGTILQSIRYKSGYMWVMAMGTTCISFFMFQLTSGMVIGFSFRAKAHFDPTIFSIYILNQFFIVDQDHIIF